MLSITTPRIIVCGTHSGVGKSLFATGLAVALRKRGVSLSCCVTGQALHQALIFNRISRRYSRVLDRRMLTPDQVLESLYQAGLGADLVLIDGQGGFYDGVAAGDTRGSDADLARCTKTPVILLTGVPEYSNSIAALIKGYSEFLSDVNVQGVVGNRLSLPQNADPFMPNPALAFLNEVMGIYHLPPFVGGLPTSTFPTPLPPPLFSQAENCTSLAMQFFLDVGSLITNHVDIDKILSIAQTAPEFDLPQEVTPPQNRRCRIAVTDDSSFNVCFQDNLDLLKYYGAELVNFSPLVDSNLPRRVTGIYITGAYLRSYGEELSRNEQMRASIREFAEAGGVVYSEGAGTAYLCRTFQLERGGEAYPGVGLIPADAFAVQQQRAFLEAVTYEDSILGAPGTRVQGVSTGEFALRGLELGGSKSLLHVLQVAIDGCAPANEGYSASAQSCATFHFLHFGSAPHVAQAIVEAAAVGGGGAVVRDT